MNSFLFAIVGESGSGKTTIVNQLESEYNLKSIASYTTRPQRYENETGHTFISSDEFQALKPDLVAYTYFNNSEYGVTTQQIDTHDLFVVDPDGVEYLFEHYTGDKKIKVIYIKTNMNQRLDRMEARGDTFEKALNRITHDVMEFRGFATNADLVVENDDLNRCVDKIWNYICEVNES